MKEDTTEHRSYVMSKVPSKGTRLEIIVRRYLFRKGFRYRINVKGMPGTPDIVLPKYRTVIFVHGCFWHGHKGCGNYRSAKTNTMYWDAKIASNQERDQVVWRKLEAMGWNVIIIWECQLKKTIFEFTMIRVIEEIVQNGEQHKAFIEKRKRARIDYLREQRLRKEKEISIRDFRNNLLSNI